jgi:hypothetical protein
MRRTLALLCLISAAAALPAATADARGYGHGYGYGHYDHAIATVVVDNNRLTEVQLLIDGVPSGTVGAEQTERFRVRPGPHEITVMREGEVLFNRTTLMNPSETIQADIAAYEGRLIVTNSTGRDARLYVDGIDRGEIDKNTERVLILPPCHGAKVELRNDKYVLDSGSSRIISGQTTRYTAQAPAIAQLTLENPLPVPLVVSVEGRPDITILAGRSATVSNVPIGVTTVTAKLRSGKLVSTQQVKVRAYSGASIVLEGPSEATLAMHNIGRADARVWIDGNLVATLDGYEDEVLDVAVGSHRVVVRDASGAELLDRRMTVAAFSPNELVFGGITSCPMPEDDRSFSATISW